MTTGGCCDADAQNDLAGTESGAAGRGPGGHSIRGPSKTLQGHQLLKEMDQQRLLAVLYEVAADGRGGLQINEPGTSRSLKTLPDAGAAWPWPA